MAVKGSVRYGTGRGRPRGSPPFRHHDTMGTRATARVSTIPTSRHDGDEGDREGLHHSDITTRWERGRPRGSPPRILSTPALTMTTRTILSHYNKLVASFMPGLLERALTRAGLAPLSLVGFLKRAARACHSERSEESACGSARDSSLRSE